MTTTRRHSAVDLLLFIVCLFAIWSVRATFLYAIDESIAPEGLRTVYSVTVKLILCGLPAFRKRLILPRRVWYNAAA
jgi:hypothetical protein